MHARSVSAEVRNPLLRLAAAQDIRGLPIEAKVALCKLLFAIRADARLRAEECWRKHKAPMAVYWKAVSVYAGHAGRVVRGCK